MKRLCIRVPNWLGDSVMARRFVTAVRSCNPEAKITLVAHRRVADYWRYWPEAELIVYDPSGGRWSAMRQTATELRKIGPFDTGYLLSPSLSSALLFAMAGIDQRVGFATDARGWLLSEPHRWSFGRSRTHLSEQYSELLGSGGVALDGALSLPLWPDADAKTVDTRLREMQLHEQRFVVAAVGTEGEAKRYATEAWIEALRIVEVSFPVICVGTEREQPLTSRIVAALGDRVYDWSGKTSLGELAVLLQLASVFVGADSGAAHLAASLGTPTAVIFGPGNPEEVSPRGDAVAVIRQPLWCAPCGKSKCPRRDHPKECLELISPAAVAQAVLALLPRP